ncbi:unnamed protein product, partial [Prorocentrum cordatum]
ACRCRDGARKRAAAMNVQQALRVEKAVDQADAIPLRMGKDKNVRRPSWDEGLLLDCASPAAAAQVLTIGNDDILMTLCKWCDRQKRAEPRPAFKGACLKIEPGKAAVEMKKSPEVNCYACVYLSIKFKPPAADAERYDLMMAALYGDDAGSKDIEGNGEALAPMRQCASGSRLACEFEEEK